LSKIQDAIDVIKEQTGNGLSYQEIGEITGFNQHKLFQWVRLEQLPSMKIAKQILRSNFPKA